MKARLAGDNYHKILQTDDFFYETELNSNLGLVYRRFGTSLKSFENNFVVVIVLKILRVNINFIIGKIELAVKKNPLMYIQIGCCYRLFV